MIILKNRAVISVSGADRTSFLQGLITNDIKKVSVNQEIYAFMLSPQGRFLYDFFIAQNDDEFLIDCSSDLLDEIVQKLSFYKLRSKVEIEKNPDLQVAVNLSKDEFENKKVSFTDPRTARMGFRAFVKGGAKTDDATSYNLKRFELRLPDENDLTYDQSFPLEFGFEDFNAIDYKKGCYVGQETTARTHYKGKIRKKVFLTELKEAVAKGMQITADEKKIGEVLSVISTQNKLLALVLLKNLDNEGNEINLKNLKLIPQMVIID